MRATGTLKSREKAEQRVEYPARFYSNIKKRFFRFRLCFQDTEKVLKILE